MDTDPWPAGPAALTESGPLSGSLSFARTAISTLPSSATVAVSSPATGGALNGITVTET
jgi:hypothetical protein